MSLSTSQFDRLREELSAHPLYRKLDTADAVRIFMQHYVMDVWASMSLLKRLQRDLTWVAVPWMPRPDNEYVRYINELVMAHESDSDGLGGFTSHFDLYLDAMEEVGADTLKIKTFLSYMEATGDVYRAMDMAYLPDEVKRFVDYTVKLAVSGETFDVCADLFFTRPVVSLSTFQVILDDLSGGEGGTSRLLYYLHRHLAWSSEEQQAAAGRLLSHLLDGDPEREVQAYETVQESLKTRLELWDFIVQELSWETAINR